jgi:hypothetical protein
MAAPSFPDIHTTGAIHFFARPAQVLTGGQAAAINAASQAVSIALQAASGGGLTFGLTLTAERDVYYLGTAEVTPQVQATRYVSPGMNDTAGKTLPMQKTNDGEDARIVSLFTRYSKPVYNLLRTNLLMPAPGFETRWARGGLVYGQMTFELWLVFEQFFNPLGTTAGLEPGFYFPQVELRQHNLEKGGTQVEGKLMVFDASGYWIPQASSQAVAGNERGWVLYSQNPADFPITGTDRVDIPQ